MQTLTLEGYLAADPSILSAQGSGKKRASFRVLETTRFRRADGTPGERTTGFNCIGVDAEASLPLFKEIVAAMDDKKVAARAADIYGRVAHEMAAQDAVLDHLKGQSDG